MHVVPNSQITTVSNRTRQWSRAVVDIGVSYEDDIDTVLAVLRSEVGSFAADPAWQARLDGDPEVLGVEQLGDKAVVVRSQVKTQPGAQWEVARELRRRFKRRLVAEGLESPILQRVVEMRPHPGRSPAEPTPATPPGPVGTGIPGVDSK